MPLIVMKNRRGLRGRIGGIISQPFCRMSHTTVKFMLRVFCESDSERQDQADKSSPDTPILSLDKHSILFLSSSGSQTTLCLYFFSPVPDKYKEGCIYYLLAGYSETGFHIRHRQVSRPALRCGVKTGTDTAVLSFSIAFPSLLPFRHPIWKNNGLPLASK